MPDIRDSNDGSMLKKALNNEIAGGHPEGWPTPFPTKCKKSCINPSYDGGEWCARRFASLHIKRAELLGRDPEIAFSAKTAETTALSVEPLHVTAIAKLLINCGSIPAQAISASCPFS